MSDLQTLIDRLRQHGLRVTPQRRLILQALCDLDGHASAERVQEQVLAQGQDVDLSTVYRTLERLRDLRILSQTDLGRGCAEFEVLSDRLHHHLICQACGHVVDLEHTYLTPAAEAIRRDFDFSPNFDHFAIFGLCYECRSKEMDGSLRSTRRAISPDGGGLQSKRRKEK
jgi:Fur family ferric uptake transcriptional regulator